MVLLIRRFIPIYIFSFFLFLAINFSQLKVWSLSGDDLYSLDWAITSWNSLVSQFTNFSGQYRPLTYLLFNLYKLALPNFLSIFILHLALLSLIPTLLYTVLVKILPPKLAFLVTTPIFFSHIFLYYVFGISSLANILISIFVLIILNIFYPQNHQKQPGSTAIILGFILVVLSVFIKETFVIVSGLYLFFILSNYQRAKKLSLFLSVLAAILTGSYYVLRLYFYHPGDINYTYIYSPATLLNNLKLFAAWLVSYPYGWQFGAPLPVPLINKAIPVLNLFFFLFSFIYLFFKSKNNLILILLWMFLSLAPFIFLSRILIISLDHTFLALLFGLALSFKYLMRFQAKLAYTFLGLIIVINMIQFSFIKPQWIRYSFVAVANDTAHNFAAALRVNRIEEYANLCIISHDEGSWATEEGKLARFITKKPISVFSTRENKVPVECQNPETLILSNNHRIYEVVK